MRFAILALALVISTSAFAQKKKTCGECKALAKLTEKFKTESKKPIPDTGPISAEGAKLINSMATSDSSLDEDELQAVVEFYRVSITRDPVRAVLELTLPTLEANRTALEAKVKKLPKTEADEILEAFVIAVNSQTADYSEEDQRREAESTPTKSR